MAKELTRIVEDVICEKIDAMGIEELQAVIRDCNGLTTTNCSWIRYGLRHIVKEVAEAQLSGLTKRAAELGDSAASDSESKPAPIR